MPKPDQGQGDSGTSHLFGSGKKFPKSAPQFEALGALDELNSAAGLARCFCDNKEVDKILEEIQNDLFSCQANLALEPGYKSDYIEEFKKERVEFLENQILKFESNLPELKNFILPGGAKLAALLHICRAKARTAERRIVSFSREQDINPAIQAYINRLSDVFFILARYINKKEGEGDSIWKK